MQISSKVALTISVVIAVVGALATSVALRVQEQERREDFAAKSRQQVDLVAFAVAPAVAARRHHEVQAVLDNVANFPEQFPDVERLEVIGNDGRIVAALDPTLFNEPAEDVDVAAIDAAVIGQERGALTMSVPVRTTHKLGVIRARFDQARLVASINEQKRNATIFVIATMVLVGLVFFLLHRRLVAARLSGLAKTAGALGEGKMNVRADSEGKDEIAALGDSFNRMAEALQHYTDDLEQIISERTDELQQANQRLEQLAITDQLTGLANRRHFDENARRSLEIARRNQRPLSLVLVDTDHFKAINDRFGHPVGDSVLQQVAKVLEHNARKADLVARVGGEEFAILMPEASVDLAAQGAERMRAALESEVHERVPELDDHAVTASFGVTSFELAEDRLEDLLSAADEALYQSKESGRNRVTIAEREGVMASAPSKDDKEVEREAYS